MCQTLCCQYYRARLGDVQSRIGLHRNWIPPTDSCGENLKKRSVVWVGERVFLMFFSLSCVLQHLKREHCVYANDRHSSFVYYNLLLNLFSPNVQVHRNIRLEFNLHGFIIVGLSLLLSFEILDIHYESWTLWSNERAAEGSLALKAFSFNCLSPLPRPQLNPMQVFTSSLNPMCAAPEAKRG